jgi:hypothetical protein
MGAKRSGILAVFAACLVTTALRPTETLAEGDETTATGKVSFKGRPVPKGKIGFHSKTRGFVGSEIVDGVFSMPKVRAGEVSVTFEFVGCPAKYRAVETTPLRARIAPDGKENLFVFELVD